MGLIRRAEEPRRVLVIAYYFPPLGLSGVQRVSKFVKFLPEFGWNPTVITASPAGYFAFDESLERDLADERIEVVRTASFDPTRVFGRRRSVTIPSEGTRGKLSRISQFLFIPDNKVGWMRSALKAVSHVLAKGRFDLLLSSAPPYTAHLIGVAAKRRHGLPLVLDFRDDWIGNPRHVYATSLHLWLHKRLERRAIAAADRIVCVNDHIRSSLLNRHSQRLSEEAISVIPQGYDPTEFLAGQTRATGNKFTLLYCGVFYDAQSPDAMLHAVARLLATRPHLRDRLRLEFAGILPSHALAEAGKLGIRDVVHFHGYLPHDEVVTRMQGADVLWMMVGKRPGAEGITTGKLFEYFGARKPILGLVPEGEAREMLRRYGASEIVDPNDYDGIAERILRLIQRWEEGTLPVGDETFVKQFDRRRLTSRLAEILDGLKAES